MHNKPKPIKAPAGQKSRPSTFGAEDFPSLANPPKQVSNWVGVPSQSPTTTTASPSNLEILKQLEAMKKRIETLERENRALKASQAATPPPPSEPVAMHTSDCSDDEQDTQSDVSGNTSVSKTVTPPGRRLLDRLLIRHECEIENAERITELWRTKLWVSPLPRNMTREAHQGRRQVRAEALEQRLGFRNGVYYVDVARPSPRGYYTAAVIHQGTQVDGLTFKATNSSKAEEVAIALAVSHANSRQIVTDTRRACKGYLAGEISPLANRLLRGDAGRKVAFFFQISPFLFFVALSSLYIIF
ncbi:hypothetical protein HPB51_029493 [Rhipicephalus microplus]|uniref:Uncharacterized protein n=1 Tax=Rhipicephalus microplus TaxID=6941 RepID=A0A9J6CU74_RHIMP|nr:hypothetical protein HPB51_029493 [Rhipicephalus microplus]